MKKGIMKGQDKKQTAKFYNVGWYMQSNVGP